MFNPMTAPEDICIPSRGEQLAAYLYRPESPHGDVPCVVMAHGFSATRDDGLPAYAEAFRDAGFAVVLFDYRHFGASTGEPRQLLDIGRQHDDYRSVIAWARRLDGIDPDRIVLWGSSFSGGHVLAVAAGDPRIAAVVSQAPFTDAIPALLCVPPTNVVRLTVAGLWDRGARHVGGDDCGRRQARVRGHCSAGVVVAQRIRCAPDAAIPVLPARPQSRAAEHAGAGVRLRERRHYTARADGQGGRKGTAR